MDANTLRLCLDEVRRRRAEGAPAALAGLLVQRRLVGLEDLLALTQRQGSDPTQQPLPARFGPYERVRPLGQGGMGAVFEVRHSLSGETFALKTLTQAALLSDGSEERLRFQREAELAVRLEHPNVVRVADYDLGGSIPWLVQELLPGGSLQERLRHGPLPPGEVVELGLVLADALAHAHVQGVIHRDIKPDNVMVTQDGQVKLTDLGLARTAKSDSTLTITGVVMGSPAYISPEQATGEKDLDSRSDIYALGATLFHMLTGQVPYDGESPLHVMLKHMNDPLPDARQYVPDVSEATRLMIQRMMAKRPEGRFQSAGQIEALCAQIEDALSRGMQPPIPPGLAPQPAAAAQQGQAARAAAAQQAQGAAAQSTEDAGVSQSGETSQSGEDPSASRTGSGKKKRKKKKKKKKEVSPEQAKRKEVGERLRKARKKRNRF